MTADPRLAAERRFTKIQRAAEADSAMQEYAAEAQAQIEKTRKLKALRLAKEAADRAAATPESKPAARRRADARKRGAPRTTT